MYQVRLTNGQLFEYNTMNEVHIAVRKHGTFIEKVSFNGPDGTRIRMLNVDMREWEITYWSGSEYSTLM